MCPATHPQHREQSHHLYCKCLRFPESGFGLENFPVSSSLIATGDTQFWLYKNPRTLYKEKKEKKNKGDKQ